MLQLHLELQQDITRFQPPQVAVRDGDDGNLRVVLLTTTDLLWRYQALQNQRAVTGAGGDAELTPESFRGTDFRISERYRCLADPRGQVQGGMGFIYEGVDLVEGTKVRESWRRSRKDIVLALLMMLV